MNSPADKPTILLTRSRQQNEPLAARLDRLGMQSHSLPLFDVVPKPLAEPLLTPLDLAVFVSVNAVRWGVPLLQASIDNARLLPCAAVGPTTAQALKEAGFSVLMPSSGFTSEHLLAELHKAFVQPQRTVLFAGEGGRDHLETELNAAGWPVQRVEVYQRRECSGSLAQLSDLPSPQVISVMSGSALNILARYLFEADRAEWKSIDLFVPSERVKKQAIVLGFSNVFCQKDPTEQGLYESLVDYLA